MNFELDQNYAEGLKKVELNLFLFIPHDNLMGRNHLGDLVADGRVILKNFRKYDVSVWTGFNWLRIGSSGWLL
jgi:hypothetical protein